jgi:hypothetical protein
MSETDAKRTKINELLDYIESRLAELEEEKEELKEFQEKDKERRCLEYALYQRELEEVAEALEEIEEDRRGEVHGANVRREQFNDRQKEIQASLNRVTPALPFIWVISLNALSVSRRPFRKLSTCGKHSPLHGKELKQNSPTLFALEQNSNASWKIYATPAYAQVVNEQSLVPNFPWSKGISRRKRKLYKN